MLSVILDSLNLKGNVEVVGESEDVKRYYSQYYQPAWLSDPFVVDMIEKIECCEVVGPDLCRYPDGRCVASKDLRGGVPMLILMLKTDLHVIYAGSGLTDPLCSSYLEEIVKEKNITLVLNASKFFSKGFKLHVVNIGKIVDESEYTKIIDDHFVHPFQEDIDTRRGMWLARQEVANWWVIKEDIRPSMIEEEYPMDFIDSQYGKENDLDFWLKIWREESWTSEQLEYILQNTFKAEKCPVYTDDELYNY